jgi:hypothetical protein
MEDEDHRGFLSFLLCFENSETAFLTFIPPVRISGMNKKENRRIL